MPFPPSGRWNPDGAKRIYHRLPEVGDLFPFRHGVWRLIRVRDLDPTEDEVAAWIASGMEDWNRPTPYEVAVEAVAGHTGKLKPGEHGGMRVPRTGKSDYRTWYVYPRGRYPICSCCGEPTPCRETLIDERVEWSSEKDDRLAKVPPGCCWACHEPITRRQVAVRYAGINLDLPLGPDVIFHTRQKCVSEAMRYEERWLKSDPARSRILTYPSCPGSLIVHTDGDSECHNGLDECRGHDTHDHQSFTACRAQSLGCPRECPPGSTCHPRARRPREGGLL
jgi:hypothetical protein